MSKTATLPLSDDERHLVEKIRDLPPEKLAEVVDFVDFLRQRLQDLHLTREAMALSEPSLQGVWDNPDDAEYDKL